MSFLSTLQTLFKKESEEEKALRLYQLIEEAESTPSLEEAVRYVQAFSREASKEPEKYNVDDITQPGSAKECLLGRFYQVIEKAEKTPCLAEAVELISEFSRAAQAYDRTLFNINDMTEPGSAKELLLNRFVETLAREKNHEKCLTNMLAGSNCNQQLTRMLKELEITPEEILRATQKAKDERTIKENTSCLQELEQEFPYQNPWHESKHTPMRRIVIYKQLEDKLTGYYWPDETLRERAKKALQQGKRDAYRLALGLLDTFATPEPKTDITFTEQFSGLGSLDRMQLFAMSNDGIQTYNILATCVEEYSTPEQQKEARHKRTVAQSKARMARLAHRAEEIQDALYSRAVQLAEEHDDNYRAAKQKFLDFTVLCSEILDEEERSVQTALKKIDEPMIKWREKQLQQKYANVPFPVEKTIGGLTYHVLGDQRTDKKPPLPE